jgi:fused signal recognition particle receptor
MSGFLQRIQLGLKKTSERLTSGISLAFTGKKVDKDTLEELEDLLIMADTGVETAEDLCEALKKEKFGKDTTPEEIRLFLRDKVAERLENVAQPLIIDTTHKPFVILMVGVNGSGKTTTCGKMAAMLTNQGYKVSMAAADTFRAAAVEQLCEWGKKLGINVYKKETGSDASGLIYDAYLAAKESKDDVLLIDTAGRLQNKQSLMAELEKIVRVIKKNDASAPHSSVIVLDAGVGQNALVQVREFNKTANLTGIILTKLDGTAKGGIILSIAKEAGLPVHYIGSGEQADDIYPFRAKDYADMLMGVE